MSSIAIQCPRCGRHWHVSDEKAGKKGRCPECGGIIHVPEKPVAPPPQSTPSTRHRSLSFIIGGGALAVLIAAIVFFIVHKQSTGPANDTEAVLPPEVVAQLKRINTEISNLDDVKTRCDALDLLAQEERCLRARDVLRKIKAYEQVTPAEYDLRSAMAEAEAIARADAEQQKRTEPVDWHLDVPLGSGERAILDQKADALAQQAKEIEERLGRLGMNMPQKTDSFGRKLVDTAALRKLLEAQEEKDQAAAAEIRKNALQKP